MSPVHVHPWRTALAIALGGAALGALVAVTAVVLSDRGEGSSIVMAPPAAGPVLDSEPLAASEPSGVITYRSEDELVAVRVDDPTARLDAPVAIPAPAPLVDPGDAGPEVYASPDGEHAAEVGRDETGTWLDVRSGGEVVFTLALAGPDDPELRGGKTLARAVEGVPLTVAWSPDSERLAVGSITDNPWALNIVHVNGWRAERHEVEGGYVGELAWSPAGDLLAISTYELDLSDHTVLLFDPRDRTIQHLVRGCSIVWSPDGAHLALRREPNDVPGLWVASVDGTSLMRIAEEEAVFPVAWTQDASVRAP